MWIFLATGMDAGKLAAGFLLLFQILAAMPHSRLYGLRAYGVQSIVSVGSDFGEG